ncbi:MAG: hypothetical protein ACOXZ5_06695 [Syntrophomonadaceae bacterium]|jgi:hypothetical protein
MSYIDNSVFINMWRGSWIFGWLLTAPELKTGYYRHSFFHNLGTRTALVLMKGLGKAGRKMQQYSLNSFTVNNFQLVLGWFMLLVPCADMISRSHSLAGYIARAVIVLIGVLLILAEVVPASRPGSVTLRLINSWIKTD